MEYTILRRGQLEGPFSQAEVEQMIGDGRLGASDLAQTPTSYYWMPLRKLLGTDAADPEEAQAGAGRMAPFREFSGAIGESVRRLFEHCPLETGTLCLVVGCVVAVLGAVAPLLMYGPWLLAALMSGALLILRGERATGIALCVGAIFLPLALILLVH